MFVMEAPVSHTYILPPVQEQMLIRDDVSAKAFAPVFRVAQQLFEAAGAWVVIFGADGSQVVGPEGVTAWVGLGRLCERVQLTQEVAVLSDFRHPVALDGALAHTLNPDYRFGAAAPILSEAGHIVGVLGVVDSAPRHFDTEARRALQDLAHWAAQILVSQAEMQRAQVEASLRQELAERERAEAALKEAYNDLKRRNQELAKIRATGNALRLNLDLDTLLQEIVTAAHESLGFHTVVLNLVDQESQQIRVRALAGLDEEGRKMLEGAVYQWDDFAPLMQPQFQVGRCYLIPHGTFDWEAEFEGPVYTPPADDTPLDEGAWYPDNALMVPVELRQGDIVGVLSVDQPLDGRLPSPETLQALEIFANQAAMAVENAKLYAQLQAELAERDRAAEALAVAKEEAEAANRAKSTFLASMSHELRTPLTAIIGYSEMLHDEAKAQGAHEFLRDLTKIQKAGRHLLNLISDILDLSKIEAGRMELYLETFDIHALVQEIVTTVRPLVTQNGNQLEVQCEPDIGTMHADMTRVRQVLLNLLSNATKFTEAGTITLGVAREGEWVVYRVKDTGIGMNEAQLGRVFEAFTQADTSTTRRYGGTGLGLTLTRHFCQVMGGHISVESAAGQGSLFTIRLPVQVSQPE